MEATNFDLSTVVTPVNWTEFHRVLLETGYQQEEIDYLRQGFTQGFSLEYQGPRDRQMTANNLKLRVGSKRQLWDKIMKEVKLGRVAGPFMKPPFRCYIQSPIGLVPKHNPGDNRLIFHLSFPEGESVNDYIPKEKATVQYQDLDCAVQMILEEPGEVYLSSADLSSAFRHCPIRPQDFPLLVMKAEHPQTGLEYYFVDKALSFGCSISCALFTRVSNAIAHVVKVRNRKGLNPYLDDFLFCNSSRTLCNGNLETFLGVCLEIGFPVSEEKTIWATQLIPFLGMLLDAVRRRILIPQEKINKAMTQIDRILRAKKIQMLDLQRLVGLLNFLCRAIVPGRAFTRRLYFPMRGLKQHHHLRVSRNIRQDLEVWRQLLLDGTSVSRPFMDFSKTLKAEEIEFYTDACQSASRAGIGCYFRPEWAAGELDLAMIKDHELNICYLELYAICVAIELWTYRIKNRRVVILSDNQAAVAMINNSSSSCPKCMGLLRMITFTSMHYNTRYFAKYLKTDKNVLADSLSRGQMARFRAHAPTDVCENPTPLPDSAWPIRREWFQ